MFKTARKLAIPIVLSLIALAATIGTVVLKNDFVLESEYYQYAVLVQGLTGLGLAGQAFAGTWAAHQQRLSHDAQVALFTAMGNIMATKTVQATGLTRDKLGLHVYLVGWSWLELVSLRYPFRHFRLARLRGDNDIKPRSSVTWTRSKGVIGLCWRRRNSTAERRFSATHGEYLTCSEDKWAAADEETRLGLTFDEWMVLRAYSYVKAVPIQLKGMDESKYIGCVSLDTTSKDNKHMDALSSEEVQKILLDTANYVARAFVTNGTVRLA